MQCTSKFTAVAAIRVASEDRYWRLWTLCVAGVNCFARNQKGWCIWWSFLHSYLCFFSIYSKTWYDLFIPRSNKVLNIIAELKPPHRSEIVAMLTAYGFRCMKYVEAYDLVISSDSHLKFEFGRLLMESDFSDNIRRMGWYGIGCHEMDPTSTHLNTTEVIQNRDLFHPRFCIFKLNSWVGFAGFSDSCFCDRTIGSFAMML